MMRDVMKHIVQLLSAKLAVKCPTTLCSNACGKIWLRSWSVEDISVRSIWACSRCHLSSLVLPLCVAFDVRGSTTTSITTEFGKDDELVHISPSLHASWSQHSLQHRFWRYTVFHPCQRRRKILSTSKEDQEYRDLRSATVHTSIRGFQDYQQ